MKILGINIPKRFRNHPRFAYLKVKKTLWCKEIEISTHPPGEKKDQFTQAIGFGQKAQDLDEE